jgi:hypothetical protein
MCRPHPATAKEHEPPSSETVDKHHGKKSENEVDGSSHNDIEQNSADAITSALVYLFRVVKENIDSTPLLQNCEADAY